MSLQQEQMNQQSPSEGIYYKSIRFLHRTLVNIKKNTGLFIICMLLGIVPLLLKNYADSNLYKASFTVAYDELFRKIYGDRLSKINTLVQRKQEKSLTTLLQIDDKAAKALKGIGGKNILGEDLTKDLNTDHIPFMVEIVVDDSSQIIPLQNGIVKFLETGNNFMAERKRIKQMENKEELEFINRQLNTIDTVYKKGKVDGTLPPSMSTTTTSSESETSTDEKSSNSLIEFSYQLYKRKQELLRKERMPQTLIVLDDAIVSTQKKKPFVIMLAIGAIVGFFFYAIMAAIILPAFRFRER